MSWPKHLPDHHALATATGRQGPEDSNRAPLAVRRWTCGMANVTAVDLHAILEAHPDVDARELVRVFAERRQQYVEGRT